MIINTVLLDTTSNLACFKRNTFNYLYKATSETGSMSNPTQNSNTGLHPNTKACFWGYLFIFHFVCLSLQTIALNFIKSNFIFNIL